MRSTAPSASLLKSRLAWAVTAYMGLQAIICYSATAWLPTIFLSHGISAETAGYMALYLQWIGVPGAFIVPILADRVRLARGISTAIFCLSYFIGALGLILFPAKFPAMIYLSLTFFGHWHGPELSVFFLFFSACTPKTRPTPPVCPACLSRLGICSRLSVLLSSGPCLTVTASWTTTLVIFALCALMLVALGFYLGRNIYSF